MSESFDTVVVGGGLVGAAVAFGMRELGARLAVLDEGDMAHRASRGNFGLVWVQGKGAGCAPYGSWTQHSARVWPQLAADLLQITGIDVALRQGAGVHVCLSSQEVRSRERAFDSLFAQPAFERYEVEMLDRDALARRLPMLGAEVAGGTWCALDGDCNPLRLLRALHAALASADVLLRAHAAVTHIDCASRGFVLRTPAGNIECARVILAAGLANSQLAPLVGLQAPVTPNKGQVVVLERQQPFLSLPLENIRQTDEGSVLIGDSQQQRGFDESLETPVLGAMSARALRIFPFLRDARVTRTWAALRVMSPDGFPIYEQSPTQPGAYVVTCHSGVTLAAAHALVLAPMLARGTLDPSLHAFTGSRFDVRAAA